jgi:release factor glutamine methyltransferase
MQEKVWKNEPSIALFVPDDEPLLFYKRIAYFAQNHLNDGGKLFFEIHFDGGKSVVDLLKTLNFKNIELRKDMSRKWRMIKCEK